MIIYVESSAVLAWLLGESTESVVLDALRNADRVVTSSLTALECARGINRAMIDGRITAVQQLAALPEVLVIVLGRPEGGRHGDDGRDRLAERCGHSVLARLRQTIFATSANSRSSKARSCSGNPRGPAKKAASSAPPARENSRKQSGVSRVCQESTVFSEA